MPLFRRVYRKYPVFLEGLRTRAERYNQCREELFALEQEGRVLVIAPANTRGFSRTERDRQKILALWQDGFFAGRRAAEAVHLGGDLRYGADAGVPHRGGLLGGRRHPL